MKKPKTLYILILDFDPHLLCPARHTTGDTPVEDLTAATATAEPTPMPTPIPTATPLEMTDDGDRAIIAGDYDRAIEIFQNALANTTDTTVTDKSNLGIGQAYYEQSNYAPALTALRLAAASADTTIAARGQLFPGAVLHQPGTL